MRRGPFLSSRMIINKVFPIMSDNKMRVAVVTGSSRGIGRAVAERLARDGLAVVINYASNPGVADEVVATIRSAGGNAFAFGADVADEVAVSAMFDQAEKEFGGVDVVVNSAGILLQGPVAEFDLAALDKMHRINIRGTFVVTQQAARRIRPGGAIVNLSTSVGRQALPTYAGYAMSKAAVEALNLILARELKGRDITVNTVGPGPTATDMFLQGKDEALVKHIANLNPFQRLGRPDEIAEVVSFLAGPARWINGQTIYVNGGMN